MAIPRAPLRSVTLSEVLHLALPSGARLIVGQDQLGKLVTWARLLGSRPSASGPVEAGEVVLCAGSAFGHALGEAQLGHLLSDLSDAGAAGLFVGGAYPQAVAAACAQAGLPLVQLPQGASLGEVERSIVGLIVDRDGQLQRRISEVRDKLISNLVSNDGLSGLVTTFAECAGKRVFVLDEYLTLQSAAPDDGAFARAAERAAAALFPRGPVDRRGRSIRAVPIEVETDDNCWTGRLEPVLLSGVWAGFLGVVGDPSDPGLLDSALAEQTAPLVAIELAKQRAIDEATLSLRGDFLEDLFDGNFPSEEAVLARARWLGHELGRPHLTFALGVEEISPNGDGRAGLLDARQRKKFSDHGRAFLLKQNADTLLLERGGNLLALVPFAEAADLESAIELLDEVRRRLEDALPGLKCTAGIGRYTHGMSGYCNAAEEAQRALAIGQRLLGGGLTVHYGALGVERLIFPLLGGTELAVFVEDMIGPLLEYDAKHRTDLSGTLEVFFASNGNHVRAAQLLHLHRNTLLYRLDRARAILGRDLDDLAVRLAIQMALQIRRAVPRRDGSQRETS